MMWKWEFFYFINFASLEIILFSNIFCLAFSYLLIHMNSSKIYHFQTVEKTLFIRFREYLSSLENVSLDNISLLMDLCLIFFEFLEIILIYYL